MAFYDKFEALCKKKGITPTGAARENGIAQSVVSMWKKRGSTPSGANLQKLASYFGISVDELIGTTTTLEEMYRKDIEKYSNMGPVGFPDNPFRQRAVNKISLVISNVDDEGVQAIVDHAEFIEQKYNERKKKAPQK